MNLSKVLEEIFSERDIAKITEKQYSRSLKSFESFLGKRTSESDLTTENVNKWVRSLQDGKSPTTCKNYKTGLLIIWNRLAERSVIAPYHHKSIRKLKIEQKPVVAWTLDEIRLLLESTELLSGNLRKSNIKASHFMRALILVAFETGLRPSDLRQIHFDQVDFEQGTITLVQQKTGQPHIGLLSKATLKAIERLKTTGLIFPLGKTGVLKWERKLYAIAHEHFGFRRKSRAGLGTLRKSHATEVYTEHGLDAAARSLGHVGGVSTAKKHYIDSRAINVGTLPRIALDHGKRKTKANQRC